MVFVFASIFSGMSATTRELLTAGGIVALSLIVGFIADRVLLGSLRKLATTTEGKLDDVIVNSVKGVAVWAFLLVGIYMALPSVPLPDNIDNQLTTGMRIAVMLLSVFVVARLASGLAVHYAYKVVPSSASLANIVVNVIIFGIGLLVIFQTMGIQIAPLITAMGVGGLAVALALQPTLANFFAGLQLLALKEINTGDFIQLDSGQEGFVHDIGWRSTTLRMVRNNLVVVPNTKMTDAIIINYALPSEPFGVVLGIGVSYASDLEKVQRVSIEVAKEVIERVEGTVKEFEPAVRFNAFGDSSINFNLVIQCTNFPAQYLATHELVKAIHKRFNQEGIEIPFPIRTVYMKNAGE
ncbi:MAG: mechanosensitive ion channel family protein [Candidatus Krumholzibacteria bacterium]|nr:mechanosensitive ion channel family protein [Candidatus Krumholzibacteria bacterium]MDH4337742.1 mechanosensitive ion channel family protein [Candidatus Krumholzibacteria bacterium]MDH5271109.1 mechanosensitive ion channel family protein [Candidatus Krumholzibacteria bacterium]MDH5627954.1 mechanosensitive ion channel family protein [Candidatus Krumholzibacteria bacterium]